MTFSDDRVVGALNGDFVCAWTNIRPDLHPSSFGIIPPPQLHDWEHNFAQGTGATNVGLLFCTSDGWVLHEMRGYFGPQAFMEELKFVLDARDSLTRNGTAVASDVAEAGMRERHQAAIRSLEERLASQQNTWSREDEPARRKPHAQANELQLRIQFHRTGLDQPLRRVEDVRPEIEKAALRGG